MRMLLTSAYLRDFFFYIARRGVGSPSIYITLVQSTQTVKGLVSGFPLVIQDAWCCNPVKKGERD